MLHTFNPIQSDFLLIFNMNKMSPLVLLAVLVTILMISSTASQSYYGCNTCCGYVAGAAGWSCCRIRGALYSSCYNNTDCTILNSQCILGCCQCPFPFYRQNTCQQCERIPRVLGSPCATSTDCIVDVYRSVCINGVCQCATAYKTACVSGYCQCVPRCLGDQCSVDADCNLNVANSICSGGTCQCATGFSPNICGQCVPAIAIGPIPIGIGRNGGKSFFAREAGSFLNYSTTSLEFSSFSYM